MKLPKAYITTIKKKISKDKRDFYIESIKNEFNLMRKIIDVVENTDITKYSNLEIKQIFETLEDIRIDLEGLL